MCKGYAAAQYAYDNQLPTEATIRQQGLLDELHCEEEKLQHMKIEQDDALGFIAGAKYLSFDTQDAIKENYETRTINQRERVRRLYECIREAS